LLKSERKRLADEANVPPYAVFSDRSLHEMAYYFPHSTQSLLQIHGVGHAKVNKYGASFIEIISEYCASNNLVEVANVTVASSVKATPSKTDAMSLKSVEIVRAFESGRSINELTKEYKIKPNTLYSHLHKYVLSGQTLQKPEVIVAQIDLSQELTAQALDAFKECGSERLKPIFERLNEQVTYEQLHLLRVYFLHQINHRTKSTKEV
jgi:ATP-dependent DNA helicase RecQ